MFAQDAASKLVGKVDSSSWLAFWLAFRTHSTIIRSFFAYSFLSIVKAC